jgi:hypothetical protein
MAYLSGVFLHAALRPVIRHHVHIHIVHPPSLPHDLRLHRATDRLRPGHHRAQRSGGLDHLRLYPGPILRAALGGPWTMQSYASIFDVVDEGS